MDRETPGDVLEAIYLKKETTNTASIYRELSARTGFEQKKLREIFASFYDIIGERLLYPVDSNTVVNFDDALRFRKSARGEYVETHESGTVVVHPPKMVFDAKIGRKIQKRVEELIDSEK